MKKSFTPSWNKSTQPRKQRKYIYNAPLHTRGRFMHSMLSKDLAAKYGTGTIRVRKGDKVRVLRGQFKKKEGAIETVDLTKTRVLIENVEMLKKDGSKSKYPVHPSNIMIIELNLTDKKRFAKKTIGAAQTDKDAAGKPAKQAKAPVQKKAGSASKAAEKKEAADKPQEKAKDNDQKASQAAGDAKGQKPQAKGED